MQKLAMQKVPKLGQILFKDGAIDEEKLVAALQKQSRTERRLGEILLASGVITESRLAEALSTQLQIPIIKLTRYQPMREAIDLIPYSVAERLQVMPLSIVDGSTLFVAMTDPLNLLAQDELRSISKLDLTIAVTTLSEFKSSLDRFYSFKRNLEHAIIEIQESPYAEQAYESKANDAPVIQFVNNMLTQAIREEASDIHIERCRHNARIRYRVDGTLYSAFEYPSGLHSSVASRLKIMADLDILEKRRPQDGHILIKAEGRYVDLRVSIIPTINGETIVIRVFDKTNSAMGLEHLGLEPNDLEKIEAFCKVPWGVILATGPSRSGKSTTLHSIMSKLNQISVKIVAVEDPVEYYMDGVNQIFVNEKLNWGFEEALRSILRQDPDKIMIGEIRDGTSAQIVIRAALTGHLVLSTLHTKDAPSTLTRLVEIGVQPFLVSATLSGVIAQRLVRKLCPTCKKEYAPSHHVCDSFGLPHGSIVWKAVGCNECRYGYRGRTGIFEIMPVDDDIRQMILDGKKELQLRSVAIEKGMKTLRQSGINCALTGVTSLEEVVSSGIVMPKR